MHFMKKKQQFTGSSEETVPADGYIIINNVLAWGKFDHIMGDSQYLWFVFSVESIV